MAKKFDLNDDSVAVVIGSGAGGGTLLMSWLKKVSMLIFNLSLLGLRATGIHKKDYY